MIILVTKTAGFIIFDLVRKLLDKGEGVIDLDTKDDKNEPFVKEQFNAVFCLV